ncbi:MAG: serine hydrolase [Gammaproteobacteria bacterium]|nr:serine hydrolase [Gammaproteobacteria bacterium]
MINHQKRLKTILSCLLCLSIACFSFTPQVTWAKTHNKTYVKKHKKTSRVRKPRKRKNRKYHKGRKYHRRSVVKPTADGGGLKSVHATTYYVVNLKTDEVLLSKNAQTVRSIASISKMMTAYVISQSHLDWNERITITKKDVKQLPVRRSRVTIGTTLTRKQLLHLAIMSSDNRAAYALASSYPGGVSAFVDKMNETAFRLGMFDTHFIGPTGLYSDNVSTAKDLIILLKKVKNIPIIRELSTSDELIITTAQGRKKTFRNSNRLVRDPSWDIIVSKTGYIRNAGRCVMFVTKLGGQELGFIVLNSDTKNSRFADALRLRRALKNDYPSLY